MTSDQTNLLLHIINMSLTIIVYVNQYFAKRRSDQAIEVATSRADRAELAVESAAKEAKVVATDASDQRNAKTTAIIGAIEQRKE